VRFVWRAFKEHALLLSIFGVFAVCGIVVIWAAPIFDDAWFVYGFGWIFILFPLAMVLFTMPSSFLHSYEKQVIAKYGRRGEAVVTRTYVDDLTAGDDAAPIVLYYVDYEFTYKKMRQFGTFYVNDKALADRIAVGDTVPIKFLAFDPTQSDVRMRSLKRKLK
jgi:hypothetical protein